MTDDEEKTVIIDEIYLISMQSENRELKEELRKIKKALTDAYNYPYKYEMSVGQFATNMLITLGELTPLTK
jgi:hypothetical protein